MGHSLAVRETAARWDDPAPDAGSADQGAAIPSHTDRGFSLTNSHRVHIAVVTNAGAGFSVGDEERHMRCGEMWEINNQRGHTAWNRGPYGRIHLIVDWVPGSGVRRVSDAGQKS